MKIFFNSDELEELIKKIQNRGGEIIKKQNLSSGLSAANAIGHHLKNGEITIIPNLNINDQMMEKLNLQHLIQNLNSVF